MRPVLALLRSRPASIALAVASCACGARTGFGALQSVIGARDAAEEDQTGSDGSAADGGGGWCSENLGPVGSCDAGPNAGFIQRCVDGSNYTTTCLNYGEPIWGCCVVNPPDGLESCFYPPAATPENRCGDYP
jgi:hypothetical protein